MTPSFFHEGVHRYHAALTGKPDRVPVFAQMHEFVLHELKIAPNKFYTSPELLVKGSLEVMETYGIDVPVLDYDVYNIEAEALGQAVVHSGSGMPDVDRSRPLVRDRSDLKKIHTPDFEKDGRFATILEMNRLFREMTGGLDGSPGFCAPFSLAATLRGIEQLLTDMYVDPEFARDLFDRVTNDVLIPWIEQLKKVCPETTGICGSDAWASLPIVNLDIIKNWILPEIKRLQKQCGSGVYVPNWVGESYLKKPAELLDLKLQACPGFVEGQDPDVKLLGPSFYKTYAEGRGVPLIIGIGAAFLAQSKPEEIRARIRQYIELAGKGGRLILYLCNLGATTPPENVKTAVKAIQDYGVY
jgi:uroporphyrinogen-III decarboxylase